MPHRASSPPLISLPLLIILLPILTLTLLFLAVPPLLSAATNILQHSPVKTTWNWNWNSFNIILVFVAILFGVFARRNEDESSPQQSPTDAVPDQNIAFRRVSVSSHGVETGGYESQQWFGFSSDETPNRLQSPVTGVNRLRRSSSSYPDLRQMETDDSRYKFRFFDDFEIEKQFRSPSRAAFSTPHHRKQLPEYRSQEEEQVHVKEIPVDTFQTRPSPVKLSSPSPPPPPPPISRRRQSQSMHQTVESRSEITELEDPEFTRIDSPPPTPPRPSAKTRSEQKHGKNERRKSNVKREIAMVWASVLSNQRKRKKKERPRNDHNHHYDNVDELTKNATAPPVTPPPPPPLPPPSVFHSIFRKGMGKSKKIHSVPAPPPPPPPSRRSAKPKNQIPQPPLSSPPSRRSSKPLNQIPLPPPTPPRQGNRTKPPLPNKSTNFMNDTLNVGNQSPLIPIPPPLPPFKIPAMKFELHGDFVKILSNQSSRCTSPEREHIDGEVSETTTFTNSVTNHKNDGKAYVFCPSPDVNAKAATFIARLRGEWRLQKLNSIKEKGNGSLPLASDLLH
ncbi:formin-like protein 5 [Lathyrus oleraceus]|uniref:formin-like protein 5 n=1 Tax=Pisum sativum TaxID=3888 RepID=UPI0021D045B2|nr:formin-like protein 5 [Pisum sativum]